MRLSMALLVCALALPLASCSSKNTGKIVGKWKMQSIPGAKDSDIKAMDALKVYTFIEFKADNTFLLGLSSDDPEALKVAVKLIEMSGQKVPEVKGSYKLLFGSGVELSNLHGEGAAALGLAQNKGRVEVTINGDSLTLKAADGTAQCVRVN